MNHVDINLLGGCYSPHCVVSTGPTAKPPETQKRCVIIIKHTCQMISSLEEKIQDKEI